MPTLPYLTDTSVQLTGTYTASTIALDNFIGSNYANRLSSNNSNYTKEASNVLRGLINNKQDILTASTNLLGIGTAITAIDYNKISVNKPTNFQADWLSTIINKPSTFAPDMTDIYNKFAVNNLISSTSNYALNISNILKTNIDTNNNNISTNYFQKSGGTITGDTSVNANLTTRQLYINSTTTTASIFLNPVSTNYSILKAKTPWAMYFAEDYNSSSPLVLPNYINNGKNAVLAGTAVSKLTQSGNGASGAITYISGTTGSTVVFPSGSIPAVYTILSLTRYTGTTDATRKRILQSTTGNWLHGHWDSKRGVAYYEGWKTAVASTGTQTDWLCFIGKNSGGTDGGNILVDGVAKGTVLGGQGNLTLTINTNFTTEFSDWGLSCVMIWDTELSDAEMLELNAIINTYKTTGVSIKSLIVDDTIIESRNYNGEEKTELLLFKGNDIAGTNGEDRIRLKAGSIAFDTYTTLTPAINRGNENIVMFINGSGNVGIGTTTNLTHKLNINGSLNSTSLYQNGTLIDFNSYATITYLSNYLTSSTASSTYATITNLNTKESILTFSAPLTRTTNNISIDLSNYLTSSTASSTYATITNLGTKESILTFSAPLTRTTNNISIDLSNYLTSSTASSTYATITNLGTKESILTFSAPLTRTTNTIGINLGSYSTTGNDANYLLKTGGAMTGQITGVTTLNATTVISGTLSTTNNTNVVAPTKGVYGGNGDRLILWAGTAAAYPFSLGINDSTLWYSVPDGATHKFYHNGSVITTISSTGLSLGNPVGYKVLSLWDVATPNNFQFVGFGNNGGLCFNTNTSTDAFQFRVGASTTAANELMRINGNGSVCIGTASATSANTKLTISGTSSGASQPIVRIEQLATWDGTANNYAFQVSGYSDLGGIRINGTDTYNTIFTTGNNDMGLSTKAGVLKFLTNSGTERMRILNNGNVGIGTDNSSSKLTVEGRTITGNGSSTYSSIFSGNTVGLTVANAAGTGNPEQLVICDTANANTALLIGSKYNAGDAFSVIQSIVAGAGYKTLSLNPNGGNIGIGTTNPSALLTLTSPTQSIARILLSGQEFYAGGFSQTSGIALLLGVNRDNNKQLWITNSANLAQNATNAVVRIGAETSGYIDCIATNGTTSLPMTISGSSITLNNNTDINGNLTIGSYITIPKSSTSTGILNLALGGTGGADDNTNMKILMYGVNSGSGGVSGSIVIRAYNDIKFFSNGQGTTPNLFIDGIYGLVGVGGITPVAKLHVASGTYTTGWLGYIALINSGSVSVVYWGNTFGGICAIFETNIWCKTNIMASSDSRIKKDIEDIDDTTALDKILSIQPKTYKYKDTLLKRDNRVIGFIAQQIKEVIPEAVELIPEYIPNIYKISTTNDDIINLDNTELLNIDDKIKIIDNSGKTEETKILEVNETSIKIDKTFNNEDVFVYGSKVDDFHSLDKSYIYTLNVCATQQLYKLIQQLQERISILEARLN